MKEASPIYKEVIGSLGEVLRNIVRRSCLPGRKHHQWRSRRTRGKPKIGLGIKCFWCRKLFDEVQRERRIK